MRLNFTYIYQIGKIKTVAKISVVINTLNEEEGVKKALQSVKWADEILVCDMHSEDKTVEIAKKLGARVFYHKRLSYVEPARNFAISKASNEWILILDPDEEIPEKLAKKLQEMAKKVILDHVEIPRKNIIFGKWMKASMWWPDHNIRFFKKGKVSWEKVGIHRPPKTTGEGLKLPAEENLAIIHYHYISTAQFIERMNRYTNIQAEELIKSGYRFAWTDLIAKPLGEFLGRFFANRGFEDGLHGLALSLLQAYSFLVMYLKIWEREKFKEQEITLDEVKEVIKRNGQEINWWLKYGNLSNQPFKRFFQKVRNKLK